MDVNKEQILVEWMISVLKRSPNKCQIVFLKIKFEFKGVFIVYAKYKFNVGRRVLVEILG